MPTLYLIRHGQASFGADNYDKLSAIGHEQSEVLGAWFAAEGIFPDLVAHGSLTRQKETLAGILKGMAREMTPEEHPGLDEFDFGKLLKAKYAAGGEPDGMMTDHKSHFRTLRTTVAEWQRDEIPNPPEMWGAFTARVDTACRALMREAVEKVFAVPGIGTHFVDAVLGKDITLIMGVVLVYSTLLITFNLAVDIMYRWADPRIA